MDDELNGYRGIGVLHACAANEAIEKGEEERLKGIWTSGEVLIGGDQTDRDSYWKGVFSV